MNIQIYKNTIKAVSALAFIFSVSFAQNVSATENEAACKAHIQDKIAWDNNSSYNSASHWEDSTLETLCKGTTNPKEPGTCFHDVMTGHVKWGKNDKWEWKMLSPCVQELMIQPKELAALRLNSTLAKSGMMPLPTATQRNLKTSLNKSCPILSCYSALSKIDNS